MDLFQFNSHIGNSGQQVVAHDVVNTNLGIVAFFQLHLCDRQLVLIERNSLADLIPLSVGQLAFDGVGLLVAGALPVLLDDQPQGMVRIADSGGCANTDVELISSTFCQCVGGKVERVARFPTVSGSGLVLIGNGRTVARRDKEQ